MVFNLGQIPTKIIANIPVTRAFGARWCRAFAVPRRERKGFLVAINGRTSSYRTRRYFNINSSAHFRSNKRSKHQVLALLNGCKHPLGSEDGKRLEHTGCRQPVGGCAALGRQVTSLEAKIWIVTYLPYFPNSWPPLPNLTSNFETHKNLGDNFWIHL